MAIPKRHISPLISSSNLNCSAHSRHGGKSLFAFSETKFPQNENRFCDDHYCDNFCAESFHISLIQTIPTSLLYPVHSYVCFFFFFNLSGIPQFSILKLNENPPSRMKVTISQTDLLRPYSSPYSIIQIRPTSKC